MWKPLGSVWFSHTCIFGPSKPPCATHVSKRMVNKPARSIASSQAAWSSLLCRTVYHPLPFAYFESQPCFMPCITKHTHLLLVCSLHSFSATPSIVLASSAFYRSQSFSLITVISSVLICSYCVRLSFFFFFLEYLIMHLVARRAFALLKAIVSALLGWQLCMSEHLVERWMHWSVFT